MIFLLVLLKRWKTRVFIRLHIPQGRGSTILGKLYEELPLLFPVFPTYLIIKSSVFPMYMNSYAFPMAHQSNTKNRTGEMKLTQLLPSFYYCGQVLGNDIQILSTMSIKLWQIRLCSCINVLPSDISNNPICINECKSSN